MIPGPPSGVRIRTTAYRRRSPVWEGWGRVANAGSMTGVPDRTTRPLGRAGHLAGDGSVEELQPCQLRVQAALRSEEHTSELQSLMRISYAVFCLKKKNTTEKH